MIFAGVGSTCELRKCRGSKPATRTGFGQRRTMNASHLMDNVRPDLIFGRGSGQIERYGRHEETRTPDLYRVKVAL
jgi:hypothetical protein